MIEVERFDVNAEDQRRAGRPLVARFAAEKKGSLDVRVMRDDGSLWLWGRGPLGGDRGHLAIGLKRAGEAMAFANMIETTDGKYGSGPSLGGGDFRLSVRRPWKDRAVDWETTDRLVSVTKGHATNSFSLRFDVAALRELGVLLREWAARTIAATMEPPAAGEFFVRGDTPGGTVDQVRAWVLAGPEGRLCQIRDDPTDGHVVFRDVLSLGGVGNTYRVPLVEFYGDGWRRLGAGAG